ncbi:MAG TPA: S41 family peptidase [Bacteroidales bacterium]|nr:S41 family peptidase [Bacteroidales bacterium]
MKKILYLLIPVLSILLLFSYCKKEEITDDDYEISIPAETLATNKWIHSNLVFWYLWNDNLTKGIDSTKEADPEAYFYKLLYNEKDRWSYITDDYKALIAELAGEPLSMGYYPAFYLTEDYKVIIGVCYVYPGSPADEAGLERGDIIISIDNSPLDTINYYSEYSRTDYSVQLGTIVNRTPVYTGESLDMTARVISADPAISHKVIDVDGHKIGYLAYVEFIRGENEVFLSHLDEIFNEFKSENISDLIIDLRYNSGGEIITAIHLASNIAPLEVTTSHNLMISYVYNNNTEIHDRMGLYDLFMETDANIDMDRVYFLTTRRSASASELTMIGLDPYMDVVQIGENTYGKYVGSIVRSKQDNEWAMMPIITKYSNAEGFTDFEDGLIPDHKIKDNVLNAVPFGDPSDPMTAKAIELATGIPVPAKRVTAEISEDMFRQISPPEMERKNILLVNKDILKSVPAR